MKAHLHFPPRHIHIARSVFVQTGKDGVARRRRRQLFHLSPKGLDLSFGVLQRRDEFLVLFGRLVELVARLIQPTDLFFHRLNLHAKFVELPSLFTVLVNHLPLPLGQPLCNLLDRISEGPESVWLTLAIRHSETIRPARNIEPKREYVWCEGF